MRNRRVINPATNATGTRVETKDDRELDWPRAEPAFEAFFCTCS